MTDKIGKFRIEYGIHGASIIATSGRLTNNCLAIGEIEYEIQSLKNALDACAVEMKRYADERRSTSSFSDNTTH